MISTLKKSALIIGLLVATNVFSCDQDGVDGFVPENDFNIPADSAIFTGINEAEFNSVIEKLETIYAPIISNLGAKLVINRLWTNGKVNASATRSGRLWTINMYGGLSRHSTITADGFALVICHELGHHLGGAPMRAAWASNEGQADYFANLKCLRKAFLDDDNISIVAALNAPSFLVDACHEANKESKEDSAICVRASMAGKSVSNLFSVLGKLPETFFDRPDAEIVKRTNHNHPKAQCRLDTYLQGSLCEINMNEELSTKDETIGTCNTFTGQKIGNRPLCWFKPKKV